MMQMRMEKDKMPLTLPELCEKLKKYDEVTLLEELNISSEDLVDRFEDFIEEKYEVYIVELEEEEDDAVF